MNLQLQIIELQRQIDALGRQIEDLRVQENSMAQNHGWISGAWQKDPIRLGYSGTVRRAWSNTSLAAGSNNVDDSAVPAGEIWEVTSITTAYIGTVTTVALTVGIVSGGGFYPIAEFRSLTTGKYEAVQGRWVMAEGDALRVQVTNATLNDDLLARAVGMRVDIDQ